MKDLSISNKIVKAAYDAGYRVDHIGNVVKDGIIKKIYILNRKPRYADFPMYVNASSSSVNTGCIHRRLERLVAR